AHRRDSLRTPCFQPDEAASTRQIKSCMTHAVTHEQKNRGGNNGEKRICGCENPAATPLYSPEIP
ncbi:MAG: hypothetical protein MSA25_10290, partial [Clostridiales bacterium]|nr:hypothetical protein [Clostridiales bacterium]